MLGIYIRTSRPKDNSVSLEDQMKLGIDVAEELGLELDLYEDKGKSAATEDIEHREGLKRLIKDIIDLKITKVYVYDESRLSRNPSYKYELVRILKEHKVIVHTTIDGVIDYNDVNSEFMSEVRGIIHKRHVTETKLKIQSTLLRNATNGKAHQGAMKPYGYTSDEEGYLVVDKEEAKVIKKIFKLSLKGNGSRAIANELNRLEIPTRGNKVLKKGITVKNKYTGTERHIKQKEIQWAPNTVLSILKNPIYKGERHYKDNVFECVSIVDAVTWEKVQVNFAKNKRTSKRNNKYQYLLKGLIRCNRCGRNYYGRTRESKKDHYYMCSSKRIPNQNCGNRSINIDRIEAEVWYRIVNSEEFLKVIDSEPFRDLDGVEVMLEQQKALETNLGTLSKQRQNAITLRTKDKINDDELDEHLNRIETDRVELVKQLDEIKSNLDVALETSTIGDDYFNFQKKLNRYKNQLDFETKVKLVHVFVKEIIVDYIDDDKEYEIIIEFRNRAKHYDPKSTFRLPRIEKVSKHHPKTNLKADDLLQKKIDKVLNRK